MIDLLRAMMRRPKVARTRGTLERSLVVLALAVAGACGGQAERASADSTTDATTAQGAPEATSLLGAPLYRRPFPPEQRARLDSNLAVARAAYERAPDNADSIIWLGRRQAYLEQYQEAIRTFTEGIAKHPNDPRLYRHRGHRYLTVREFDKALADLQRAAELARGTENETEPDGAPNARNIPTSTSPLYISRRL